jgi:hypothetical protein
VSPQLFAVCREHRISDATFYIWKKQYSELVLFNAGSGAACLRHCHGCGFSYRCGHFCKLFGGGSAGNQ